MDERQRHNRTRHTLHILSDYHNSRFFRTPLSPKSVCEFGTDAPPAVLCGNCDIGSLNGVLPSSVIASQEILFQKTIVFFQSVMQLVNFHRALSVAIPHIFVCISTIDSVISVAQAAQLVRRLSRSLSPRGILRNSLASGNNEQLRRRFRCFGKYLLLFADFVFSFLVNLNSGYFDTRLSSNDGIRDKR